MLSGQSKTTEFLHTSSTRAVRHLSRLRPTAILAIFVLTVIVVSLVVDRILSLVILHPLAVLHFRLASRKPALDVTPSSADPEGAATFVIGARPENIAQEQYNRQLHVNYAALPLRRPEADLILSYLKPTDVYLEFGASATTLAFPHLVSRSYSIEHDIRVCEGIAAELREHQSLQNKLRAFCAPVRKGHANWGTNSPFEEGSYVTFQNYVDFPQANLSGMHFDKVLINGRARVACALRILPMLTANSLVFFHDYFARPQHYAAILPYYEEVARVVAHGSVSGYSDDPMGLVVFRPRVHFTADGSGVVSVKRINAIYDVFVEQPPTDRTTGLDVAVQYGLQPTEGAAYPYARMTRQLSKQTTRARLLIDLAALPIVIGTYVLLHFLFVNVFRDAMALSRASRAPHASRASTPITSSSPKEGTAVAATAASAHSRATLRAGRDSKSSSVKTALATAAGASQSAPNGNAPKAE